MQNAPILRMDCTRIILWSGPRSVSTALMYAFDQRSDTQVIDEPLYAYYLHATNAQHPGRQEILEAMDKDGTAVLKRLVRDPCDSPVLFVKNMAHHLCDLDRDILTEAKSVFLIRDPKELILSLVHQIPRPTLADTAIKDQYSIYRFLEEAGQQPPVVDSRELLLNPPLVLGQLCRKLALEPDDSMLSWPAGPIPEDGIWAPHWYHNVHKSTGFLPYRPKNKPVPRSLRPLLADCEPYYQYLYDRAIKV